MLTEEIRVEIVEALSFEDEKTVKNAMEITITDDEYERKIVWLLKQLARPLLCVQICRTPFYGFEEIFKEDAIINELKILLENTNCLSVKAKFKDCLWNYKRDYRAAEEAANLYMRLLEQTEEDSLDIKRFLYRILSLFIFSGNQTIKTLGIKAIKDTLEKMKGSENYTSYNILNESMEHKFLSKDEVIMFCKEFEKSILKNKNLKVDYLELLDKLMKENDREKNQIKRKKASLYIELAEEARHPMEQVNLLKQGIEALKRLPGTEQERVELRKKLSDAQGELMGTMQSIPHKVDISDHVKQIQESIKVLDPKEYFYYLLLQIVIAKKEDVKAEMIKNKAMSISGTFPSVILDKAGRTITSVPGVDLKDEKNILANMEDYVKIKYYYYTNTYLAIIINELFKTGVSFEEEVTVLIENCCFIPEKRKNSFKAGIMAGFKRDYLTALHILIPQIENAVRCLAEECGDVGYSIKEDGDESARTLHDLLESEKVVECIDEDILFNMRAIFTSPYGLNMRNELAHGLLDDADFNSWQALYTWCFILRLCFVFSRIDREKAMKIKEKLAPINYLGKKDETNDDEESLK